MDKSNKSPSEDEAPVETAPDDQTPEPHPQQPHPRILPIHLLGSKVLRQHAADVGDIDDTIRELAQIMVNTMHHVNGIGLAAPQIGIPLRLFVMLHRQEEKTLKLANPVIESVEGTQDFTEGCLSQPGLSVIMKRPKYVTVRAVDVETGQTVIVEGTELEAACLSHELDHLNGRLICDSISRLKRQMYQAKLNKRLKQQDRAQQAQKARDERDHPHYHEPHK